MKIKLLITVICLGLLIGCSGGVKNNKDGSIDVSDGYGQCSVYIIEKDGYKFAVAVGYHKCAITQIKD